MSGPINLQSSANNLTTVASLGSDYQDTNVDTYMDDVYVDSTFARVEACSGATWASRGHCEMQPASAWTDGTPGSISVTFNQGSFSASDTVYLYVVDSTNDPSPASTALTVGSGSTNPVITSPGSVSQSETSYSLSTSYTIESGRTVSSSTWSNSLGGSGSLTANSGTLSGSITGLSTGDNVITLSITDSEDEIGTAQFTITVTTTRTCYLDADGDGYSDGTSESGVETCSTNYYEAGDLTETSGDCNDSNAAINPGATEICGNGIDEDCSGGDATCPAVSTVLVSGTRTSGGILK